ncbi:MAG: hypothetical protein ACRCX8_02615 [Sarcina sp.]
MKDKQYNNLFPIWFRVIVCIALIDVAVTTSNLIIRIFAALICVLEVYDIWIGYNRKKNNHEDK